MEKWKNKSNAPHIRGGMSTSRIMQLVWIALLPAAVFGVVNFGTRALMHILICIVACALTEFTVEAFANLPLTSGDCSALVTGLLLALSLPVSAPLWIGAIGGVFAIAIVKICFGGLGKNILNPALTARCFLMLLFREHMTNYVCDAYSGATPLDAVNAGHLVDPYPMFLGNTGGCIGETSVIAILAGAIFLLAIGIIQLRIPFAGMIAFGITLTLFGGKGFDELYLVTQFCGGGFMLAIWFMATDYSTSPITRKGKYIYGALIGIFTALLRIFAGVTEGVAYAILFANLLVPFIEKRTMPKAFGKKRRQMTIQ